MLASQRVCSLLSSPDAVHERKGRGLITQLWFNDDAFAMTSWRGWIAEVSEETAMRRYHSFKVRAGRRLTAKYTQCDKSRYAWGKYGVHHMGTRKHRQSRCTVGIPACTRECATLTGSNFRRRAFNTPTIGTNRHITHASRRGIDSGASRRLSMGSG